MPLHALLVISSVESCFLFVFAFFFKDDWAVCLLVGCLTSQQRAIVSQGRALRRKL